MLDYYSVSGCYILKPWSFSIWEVIQGAHHSSSLFIVLIIRQNGSTRASKNSAYKTPTSPCSFLKASSSAKKTISKVSPLK